MKMLKGIKGFTLVELIIVLMVIAIILGVVLPAIRGMQEEANLTRAEQELNTIRTAVTSYWRHNGAFPGDIHATLTGASPQIIEQVLDDPFNTDATNNTYGYGEGAASNGDYYFIYSQGPDGVSATSFNAATDQIDTSGDDIVVSNIFINRT